MNLVKWNFSMELEKISCRLKSFFQAISIPHRGKSTDIDYTGLNAALRRYEQERQNIQAGTGNYNVKK